MSRAAITRQLERHPAVRLVDQASATPGTVAVFVADTWDGTTAVRLHGHGRRADARSVLVVRHLSDPDLLEALAARVRVILWSGEASSERLYEAALTAFRGDGALPPDLQGRLLRRTAELSRSRSGATTARTDPPSPWEIAALRLLADGCDTEEMARTLGCSALTVEKGVGGLLGRLGLRNRTHAVAYAWREGLI
ncbi:LuxR C-terminal-related transcriptional regulator [Streptomyces sp. AC627_RSS907]|uniref:LuxR C-terminal-related transcriptional regulator n=1 Tax=Streptomyces sp. AC627_RSS907 TaxID=2823684 RepID=UPI001C25CC2B|nr:LuxR C-terminal-related transcriptional regulator [Streptomyces sp. AC627_RSS907]